MKELLTGKNILITGASGDIGLQVGLDCYQQGAVVLLVGYKNTDRLSKEFKNLDSNRYKIYQCDLTCENDVKKLIGNIEKTGIKVDGLFNNAGDLYERKKFINSTWDLYESSLNVNFKSAYLLTLYSRKVMNRGVSIVMMSSMTARSGKGDRSIHYGTSKSAIAGFGKCLSYEISSDIGGRVNIVSPGYIAGSFHNRYTEKKVEIDHAKDNPLSRVGTSKDVSGVVMFLLSDMSSYVNGATIDINGGSLTI